MKKFLPLFFMFVLFCAPSMAEEITGPCNCGTQIAMLDEDDWDEHERLEEDREQEEEDELEEERDRRQEEEQKNEITEEL